VWGRRRRERQLQETIRAEGSEELHEALREVRRQARVTRVNSTTLRHVARVQSLARGTAERAAQLTGAPMSAINLIFSDFQLTVAGYGSDEIKTDLDASYCKHVVEQKAALGFESTLDEPLVCQNLATTVHGIRSYLGVPLITHDDYVIGALCVADYVPRTWGENDIALLRELAADLMRAEAPRTPDLFPPGRRR
jgi:GAF domain-containing protein